MTEKTLAGAQAQHVEIYGSALALNAFLKIALLLVSLLAIGLVALNFRTQAQAATVKPVIIRIDDLGNRDVLAYDESTSAATPTDIKRDLNNFIVHHYSRRHLAVSRDFPDSLYFLDPPFRDATSRALNPEVKKFINSASAEETDVVIKHVKILELSRQPFKAQVDFEQQYYQPGGSRTPRKPAELWSAILDFYLRSAVPADYAQVNPLGLQITHIQLDPASK